MATASAGTAVRVKEVGGEEAAAVTVAEATEAYTKSITCM